MFAVAAYSAKAGTSRPKMSIGCSVLVGSGIRPMKFEKRMKKKSVARNGNYFAAILSLRLSRTIWLRIVS